ncbi:hypothetical protein BZB76_1874 [Actinomadura pelletieri DSM 43383]|uniref:Uncharacterized protein n=1 Tax=Actinomadura pelletieri DSM 43383 TaxID=1120940 RepID=A0A495QSU6_9ACTN|nr:hypothetical protein BZB76_1874 [Actinomadura pelletieri DSM 43383]
MGFDVHHPAAHEELQILQRTSAQPHDDEASTCVHAIASGQVHWRDEALSFIRLPM